MSVKGSIAPITLQATLLDFFKYNRRHRQVAAGKSNSERTSVVHSEKVENALVTSSSPWALAGLSEFMYFAELLHCETEVGNNEVWVGIGSQR